MIQRDLVPDEEAAAAARARGHSPPKKRDPLPHPDEPVTSDHVGHLRGRASAVVGDFQYELVLGALHDNLGSRPSPGVFQHVGEALLQDPVCREPDGGRQVSEITLDRDRDLESSLLHLRDELVESVETWLGAKILALVISPQHS